jgi:transcriptional regulator GlxA family with amidase domain
MPPQRDGGQRQYIPAQMKEAPACSLTPTLEWMQQRLAEPLSVAHLARRSAMAPRTFARRFREATGTTPHHWLTHQRVLAAQRRLETSDESIDAIAEAVGLQTAATLRHHFSRTLSTTPTAYRRRFSRLSR